MDSTVTASNDIQFLWVLVLDGAHEKVEEELEELGWRRVKEPTKRDQAAQA